MSNNFEHLPHTAEGALYDLPPGTLCADGCGQIVEKNKPYARIGADQFFIEGHEQNRNEDPTLH